VNIGPFCDQTSGASCAETSLQDANCTRMHYEDKVPLQVDSGLDQMIGQMTTGAAKELERIQGRDRDDGGPSAHPGWSEFRRGSD